MDPHIADRRRLSNQNLHAHTQSKAQVGIWNGEDVQTLALHDHGFAPHSGVACGRTAVVTAQMAAAKALIDGLELAGVRCQELRGDVEQACQDSSAATVVAWLTDKITGGTLSSKQYDLIHSIKRSAFQPSVGSTSHTPDEITDALIKAVQRENESRRLLEARLTEKDFQQKVAQRESTLLQLQSKLKSLQHLGSAFSSQAAAEHQDILDYHSKKSSARLAGNAERLSKQQSACNALLQDLQRTAGHLQVQIEQQAASWLLPLADLQNLHHQDACFQTAADRCDSCNMLDLVVVQADH